MVDHTSDVYNQRNMEPFLTIAIVIMVICTRLDDLKKEYDLVTADHALTNVVQ